MPAQEERQLQLATTEDVVLVRQAIRQLAADLGFSLVDQTKLVTAASELARNAVIHGGGGFARIGTVSRNGRSGIRVVFQDSGPGIADIQQAMKDGYTTAGGLGLGLGGAKRLTDEFEIESRVGEGTRICVVRWR